MPFFYKNAFLIWILSKKGYNDNQNINLFLYFNLFINYNNYKVDSDSKKVVNKMKKWRCTVCNYVHEGETPPDKCPICGVGPDKFVLIEETEAVAPVKEKKWRCTVCNYIHVGDTPPDVCPVCGVGPEKFVLVEEVADGLTDKEREAYDLII